MSASVRQRLSRLNLRTAGARRSTFGFSPVEILAVVAALGLLVAAVVYYSTALRPVQQRLRAVEAEYERELKEMSASSSPSSREEVSPAERVKGTLETLATLKSDYLPGFSSGRISLINELNALVKKHGVQLTSGIDLSSGGLSEEREKGAKAGSKTARKKADELATAFPSVSVRIAVFGQYDKLREFIGDLEANKQFLVVDSMSLVNQEVKATTGRGSRAAAAVSGITLSIEMTAYYRPEGGA